MLAQRKYKSSHDSVVKAVHWCLCRKYGLTVAGKWYEHVPEKVRESGKSKSFGILANRLIISLNTIELTL